MAWEWTPASQLRLWLFISATVCDTARHRTRHGHVDKDKNVISAVARQRGTWQVDSEVLARRSAFECLHFLPSRDPTWEWNIWISELYLPDKQQETALHTSRSVGVGSQHLWGTSNNHADAFFGRGGGGGAGSLLSHFQSDGKTGEKSAPFHHNTACKCVCQTPHRTSLTVH